MNWAHLIVIFVAFTLALSRAAETTKAQQSSAVAHSTPRKVATSNLKVENAAPKMRFAQYLIGDGVDHPFMTSKDPDIDVHERDLEAKLGFGAPQSADTHQSAIRNDARRMRFAAAHAHARSKARSRTRMTASARAHAKLEAQVAADMARRVRDEEGQRKGYSRDAASKHRWKRQMRDVSRETEYDGDVDRARKEEQPEEPTAGPDHSRQWDEEDQQARKRVRGARHSQRRGPGRSHRRSRSKSRSYSYRHRSRAHHRSYHMSHRRVRIHKRVIAAPPRKVIPLPLPGQEKSEPEPQDSSQDDSNSEGPTSADVSEMQGYGPPGAAEGGPDRGPGFQMPGVGSSAVDPAAVGHTDGMEF